MKTKKTKEAVSLIVLVLTIVIMIILAGVIVITLNNSGIIDRAKGAVSETNFKNMQELANVAWGEAYLAIKGDKTAEDIKELMLEKLKGKGVTAEELENGEEGTEFAKLTSNYYEYTIDDVQITEKASLMLFDNYNASYWLATPFVRGYATYAGCASFGMYNVNYSCVHGGDLWYSDGDYTDHGGDGVRAVVTLSKDIEFTEESSSELGWYY